MLCLVGCQAKLLIGSEVVTVAPHQRHQAAILGSDAIDVSPQQGREVVIDDADQMEAVGHNACVGDAQADQRTVVRRQVHAHHAHLGLAFQLLKVGLQREVRPDPRP